MRCHWQLWVGAREKTLFLQRAAWVNYCFGISDSYKESNLWSTLRAPSLRYSLTEVSKTLTYWPQSTQTRWSRSGTPAILPKPLSSIALRVWMTKKSSLWTLITNSVAWWWWQGRLNYVYLGWMGPRQTCCWRHRWRTRSICIVLNSRRSAQG